MKKNNPAVVVIAVIVIVSVVVGVGYLTALRGRPQDLVTSKVEVFHTEGFPLDFRFYKNQLITLNQDNTLYFFDPTTQQMTPFNFPSALFDSIHHFSFSPTKNKAFVIGSKQTDTTTEVRYALIDLERYVLVWFPESALNEVGGVSYRVHDIVMDSAGEEFLFSLVKGDQLAAGQTYELVAVDPTQQMVRRVLSMMGDHSLEYYNSQDQRIVYNIRTTAKEEGIILAGDEEQRVAAIESISVFPNDIVFGSYTAANALTFSSVNAPGTVRLTIRPDSTYPLLSPSVVRSVSGTYTAYHAWKPVTREGVVRVVREEEIVVDQPVKGSVEMFFAPDDKRLLIMTEQTDQNGMAMREARIVDVTTQETSTISLPASVSSIIDWNPL